MIYHIAIKDEWEAASRTGTYWPSQPPQSLFIHLSFESQVIETANRWFLGRRDLLLLQVDDSKLGDALRVEANLPGGEKFPHLYRQLKTSEVVSVHDFLPAEDGSFSQSTRF